MRRHNQCTSRTNTTACRFQDCRLGIPVSIITELFQMRTHQEKYFFSETSRILLATSRKCTMGQLYFLLVVDQIPEMTCYHDHARRVGAPCCWNIKNRLLTTIIFCIDYKLTEFYEMCSTDAVLPLPFPLPTPRREMGKRGGRAREKSHHSIVSSSSRM